MLAQLEDDTYLGKAVAVTTTTGTPSLLQMLRNEAGTKDRTASDYSAAEDRGLTGNPAAR